MRVAEGIYDVHIGGLPGGSTPATKAVTTESVIASSTSPGVTSMPAT